MDDHLEKMTDQDITHCMRRMHFSQSQAYIAKQLCQLGASLVSRHQIFRARPAALLKNRVWTRSSVKLGLNHTSISACRTNQIAQVK